MKSWADILKGLAIGVANIIPGVSGGTMAFILGIYEKLTEAIGEFFTNKSKRAEYFWFLLRIALGAGLGILLFAKLIDFLLHSSTFQVPTFFFFAGLIAGSIPFILKSHHDMNATPDRIIILMIALALVVISALLGEGKTKEIVPHVVATLDLHVVQIQLTSLSIGRVFWLLFCGFFASASMIVPGFSGSALLVTLGEYRHVVEYLNQLNITPLFVLGIGGVLGILAVARLIDWLLKHHTARTLYFILGLMIASLFQIFMEARPDFNFAVVTLVLDVVFLTVGFGLAFGFSKINKEKS